LNTGEGENAHKVRLPFKKPHFEIALQYEEYESTRKKITESTDFVNENINHISEKPKPAAEVEFEALLELKRAAGTESFKDENKILYVWDYIFYSNLTKIKNYLFSDKKFSELFAPKNIGWNAVSPLAALWHSVLGDY
jgi:Zn-dependent oligopeptidase